MKNTGTACILIESRRRPLNRTDFGIFIEQKELCKKKDLQTLNVHAWFSKVGFTRDNRIIDFF